MKHVKKLAQAGRGGDNTIGHLTTGEIIIPKSAQTPRLIAALMGEMSATGHDMGRYVVGGEDDSRNPKTGLREFMDSDGQGTSEGAATGAGTDSYGSVGGGYGDAPGPQGGGGQIADLSPADQASLGFNPNDLADTRSVEISAGPNEAAIGSWARDTFGNKGLGALVGWGADKVGKMADNPFGTITDIALGAAIPGYTIGNGLYGLATDKSVGRGIVGGIASAVNGSPRGAGPAETITGLSTGESVSPYETDASGRGDEGAGTTNPFGSANSPLAQALLGNGPSAIPDFGGRKTFGPRVSSYSPYGREYVTPWAYRG